MQLNQLFLVGLSQLFLQQLLCLLKMTLVREAPVLLMPMSQKIPVNPAGLK
jgi:hypothetical protein